MSDRIENFIKQVYRKWKTGKSAGSAEHPDEEALVCFIEGRIREKTELKAIELHISVCERCADIVAAHVKLGFHAEEVEVPEVLLMKAKNILGSNAGVPVLEVFLRLKGRLLELINTTGDVLVGQELVPAAILRSRSIKDFKGEVRVLKDFGDMRAEVKIENKDKELLSLRITVKEKGTNKEIKDLRITLVKGDRELESYHTDSGNVDFENIRPGEYKVEISDIENQLASIMLDIKK